MIAFTGLVVSVAVVVVQFGAGQYSPRLVLRFRRDLLVKHALGMFIAPALYALVTLGVGGPGRPARARASRSGWPIALLVVAVLAFFTLVARLLDLLRPRRLYAQLLAGCERAIDQVYPLPFDPGAGAAPELGEVTATVTYDGGGGVVSALDRGRLVGGRAEGRAPWSSRCSRSAATCGRGAPLVRVRGGPGRSRRPSCARSIIVAEERTLVQDPAFAIRAIVDISIRALSPATNDPTTGTQALDTLESILHLLAERAAGGGLRARRRPGRCGWSTTRPAGRTCWSSSLTEIRTLRRVLAPGGAADAGAARGPASGRCPPERRPAVRAQLALLDAAVAAGLRRPGRAGAGLAGRPRRARRAGRRAHAPPLTRATTATSTAQHASAPAVASANAAAAPTGSISAASSAKKAVKHTSAPLRPDSSSMAAPGAGVGLGEAGQHRGDDRERRQQSGQVGRQLTGHRGQRQHQRGGHRQPPGQQVGAGLDLGGVRRHPVQRERAAAPPRSATARC